VYGSVARGIFFLSLTLSNPCSEAEELAAPEIQVGLMCSVVVFSTATQPKKAKQ